MTTPHLSDKGRRLAIVIGCARFDADDIDNLKYTEKDAEAIQTILSQSHFTCDSHFQSPGWNEINRAIYEGLRQAKPDDTVLLYYSGHGFKDERGRLYLAGRDTDRNELRVSAVSTADVREQLEECRSKRICVILDCCFSGAFGQKGGDPVAAGEVNQALAGEGTFIMTSAQSTQTARERDDFQHGVFTHYLLEGMKGPADQNEDGFITPGELIDYVAMKMADEVGDLQKPVRDARIAGGSFHIVTNHEQREKLAQALRTQVEEETARKHHARALALLEAEDAHGVSKAERERLRTMVERDIVQVSDEFRARLADAVKAQTLAANVLSEFDELSKADPQFLFVRTEDMPRQREKLLRSALLNRVQIDALADLWPGPGGSWPPRPALRDTEPTVVPGQTDQRRQGARPVIEPPPPPGPPPPPAPPTRWRVLLAAGLAGAAGLALWMWLTPPVGPTLDRRNLQAGLVVRDGWDAAEQAAAEGAYARLIERVNQEIERAWPEEGRIRFNVADIEPYYSNEQVMEALERGAVQLVGELSPYNVYEAARRAQAQPFVQPQWDGRNTYRTVIVGLDPSVISLDQLTRKLVDDRKRVAVSDRASTSGYWYPRAMLVGHETIKESLRPFGDFVEQPSDILKAVCERESNYIAGVVPSYQWDTWAGTPEGRRRRVPESAEISPDFSPCVLTQIQRSPPIPNGAYVISSQLNAILRDRGDRLDNLQDAWTNAVSSFPGTILFPERFENVTFSAYNKDDIFGAKEAGEERVEANMQMTIIIPALVLVGVGLFTVFRRLSRVKATDHPDRVPDRT